MRSDLSPQAGRGESAARPDAIRPVLRLLFLPRSPISNTAFYPPPSQEHHMSFYDAAVPAYLQMLNSLSGLLTKAEAHCKAKNIDYVKSFKPAQFDGADQKDVTFPAGPDRSITVKGQQFLSSFSFPNFYFHAATAHGILRHNGVEIGKRDFLGVA